MDNKELIDILEDVIEYPDLNSKDDFTKNILKDFIKIYSDGDFRHSYYEISSFMEKLGLDERDSLEGNLECIFEYADEIKTKKEIMKKFAKLLDHISLERLRLSRMEKIKYIEDKVIKEMTDTKSMIESKQIEMREIQQQVTHVHSETITILGIFAGLVIGFATSFQLLAKSFENLNDVKFYKEISYLAVIGIILFDCIFFLLFAVARISKRSLALNCKYQDCNNCHAEKPCKRNLRKIHKKYPYVFWYNLSLIIVIIICIAFEIYKIKM